MQPKVSQEILDNVRVASIFPPAGPTTQWGVSINTKNGEFFDFPFADKESAEAFFKDINVAKTALPEGSASEVFSSPSGSAVAEALARGYTHPENSSKTLDWALIAAQTKEVLAAAPSPAAGPRLYTHEQVKEIVAAAVIPVVDPVPPPTGLAGIWKRLRDNWKVASLAIGLVASLISSFVTLKVVLGPVKVPDIVITLPDGSVVPSSAVEVKYKTPVTNGLPD